MSKTKHDCGFVSDVLEGSKVEFAEGEIERHSDDWATEGRLDAAPDVVVYPETTGGRF